MRFEDIKSWLQNDFLPKTNYKNNNFNLKYSNEKTINDLSSFLMGYVILRQNRLQYSK